MAVQVLAWQYVTKRGNIGRPDRIESDRKGSHSDSSPLEVTEKRTVQVGEGSEILCRTGRKKILMAEETR
jgi:hypothetical protein